MDGGIAPARPSPEPIALGVGGPEILGPNPYLAAGLAVLVGLAVFFVLLKIRKTFGMKE